jgi:hypothetical protein
MNNPFRDWLQMIFRVYCFKADGHVLPFSWLMIGDFWDYMHEGIHLLPPHTYLSIALPLYHRRWVECFERNGYEWRWRVPRFSVIKYADKTWPKFVFWWHRFTNEDDLFVSRREVEALNNLQRACSQAGVPIK